MKINELEPNKKVVNLVGELLTLEEPNEIPSGAKVQDGVLQDSTGQVRISFWEDNAGKFKQGDKIILQAGWCKMFENELQVSTGKFGKAIKYTPPQPEET